MAGEREAGEGGKVVGGGFGVGLCGGGGCVCVCVCVACVCVGGGEEWVGGWEGG